MSPCVANGRQYGSDVFSVNGVVEACDDRDSVGSKVVVFLSRYCRKQGGALYLYGMVSGCVFPARILIMKGCKHGRHALMIARFCAICWQTTDAQLA